LTVEQEDLLLRKRARRRLIGAATLTLMAVFVLPLLLDQPVQPLGQGTDIVLPGQGSEPLAAIDTDALAGVPGSLPDAAISADAVPIEEMPEPLAGAETPPPVAPVIKPAAPKPSEPKVAEIPLASPAPPASAPAATPAAPVTVPTPAVPAVGGFVVQLGVFRNRDNAKRVADAAAVAGLRPSLAQQSGGAWRVGLGPFTDREQAMAARDRAIAAGLDAVIKSP